jgi:hypothetical protein
VQSGDRQRGRDVSPDRDNPEMERAVGHVVSRFLVFYVRKYKGYRRCRVEWINLSPKFYVGARDQPTAPDNE